MRGKCPTAAVLWGAASRISLKRYTASLCRSHLAFAPVVSLSLTGTNHTIALTRQQLGRIPVSFYLRSDFHMADNLAIAIHALPMRLFTRLSVDEILLLRYMNWSVNFGGLPFNDDSTTLIKTLVTCEEAGTYIHTRYTRVVDDILRSSFHFIKQEYFGSWNVEEFT